MMSLPVQRQVYRNIDNFFFLIYLYSKNKMFEAYYKSPIGNLRIISNERDIIEIQFTKDFLR